jgi:TatD DNase family protein
LLVDTHCHLGHIEAAVGETLTNARAAGVDVVVDVGMGTSESAMAVERAKTLEGVYAAVGIHPNDLDEFDADADAAIGRLRVLAADARVVGIGETGLDFYRDRWSASIQEESFRAHIALARATDLTLVIHCRDAHQRVLEILDDSQRPDRVVMHCFSSDAAYARLCADRGFFCSFAGNVTYKSAARLRAAAAALPRRLLLAETDAPFLAPVPHRGKPNAPRLLPLTVEALAAARSEHPAELGIALRDNSFRAFRLDNS